jgi:copper chaperone
MQELRLDNLKCAGCANSLKNTLAQLEGVSAVCVDVSAGTVRFELRASEDLSSVVAACESLGYPVQGSQAGLHALGLKAKSYLSCALGRVRTE